MNSREVDVADERSHQPVGHPAWSERWWFTADAPAGRLELTVARPAPPRPLGYRLVLVGEGWGPPGTGLVLVADPAVSPPRDDRLELRAPGLWADHICEEPLHRWSVGLEAFGVALDELAEADADDPYGHRCAVGADLGWEHTDELIAEGEPPVGFRARCRVTGEVLVDDAVHDIDTTGERGRCWGRTA